MEPIRLYLYSTLCAPVPRDVICRIATDRGRRFPRKRRTIYSATVSQLRLTPPRHPTPPDQQAERSHGRTCGWHTTRGPVVVRIVLPDCIVDDFEDAINEVDGGLYGMYFVRASGEAPQSLPLGTTRRIRMPSPTTAQGLLS